MLTIDKMKMKMDKLRKLKMTNNMNENSFSNKPFILKDSNGTTIRTYSSKINTNYPDGIKQLFKYLGID